MPGSLEAGFKRNERAMATFELYKRKDGEYSWRLKSSNGQVIASAGEGFSSKAAAQNGIDAVKKGAADAKVVEIDA